MAERAEATTESKGKKREAQQTGGVTDVKT